MALVPSVPQRPQCLGVRFREEKKDPNKLAADAIAADAEFCMHMGREERLELSRALVQDTLAVLPVKPDHISNVQGPFLEVTEVAGDGTSIDFHVIHHFRAHFAHQSQVARPSNAVGAGVPALNIVELHEGEDEQQSSEGLQQQETSAAVSMPQSNVQSTSSGSTDARQSSERGVFSTDLAHLPSAGRALRRRDAGGGLFRGSAGGSTPWELDPEQVLVGERLAVGGFAEVFFGKYQGTLVAVKVLVNVDTSVVDRFQREVRLLAGLRHPNLILFMGYVTQPHLAIVSEFMHRGSLFRLLRKGGNRPLELRQQRAVAVCVARGMAYLHTRVPPVLHLDLKSPNILIDDRWRVKIADFGLSRFRYHTFVSAGGGAGTPEWMAPEVLRSENYDESADVFSYGVVLWEVLTGHQPWDHLHPMQVVGAVGFQCRTLPLPTEGDSFIVDLCRRCMAQDPRQRPSFPTIVEELEQEYAPSQYASLRTSLSQASLSSDRELATLPCVATADLETPAQTGTLPLLPLLPSSASSAQLLLTPPTVSRTASRASSGAELRSGGTNGLPDSASGSKSTSNSADRDSGGRRCVPPKPPRSSSAALGKTEKAGIADSASAQRGRLQREHGMASSSPLAQEEAAASSADDAVPRNMSPGCNQCGDGNTQSPHSLTYASPFVQQAQRPARAGDHHPPRSITNDSPFAQVQLGDDPPSTAAVVSFSQWNSLSNSSSNDGEADLSSNSSSSSPVCSKEEPGKVAAQPLAEVTLQPLHCAVQEQLATECKGACTKGDGGRADANLEAVLQGLHLGTKEDCSHMPKGALPAWAAYGHDDTA